MGQQRHPAVPRISGCRSVPPSPTSSSEHPYPTQEHTQINIIPCQNTQTPTKQQWGNMHMSRLPQWKYCPLKQVCITGIFQVVGACWQKLEKQQVTTTQNHSPNSCLTTVLSSYSMLLFSYSKSKQSKYFQEGEEYPVNCQGAAKRLHFCISMGRLVR